MWRDATHWSLSLDFNIAYLGPEALYHLRRDFILGLKYGLEDLGHRASLGGQKLHANRLNLVIGAYFLSSPQLHALTRSEFLIAHINTEIIADDMLNYNPDKVDFLGAYLPALQAGEFIWDAVIDNMAEHQRYGNDTHFLRWGWHPKMEDIDHSQEKDLDFYFFGMISPRRREILESLSQAGLEGRADNSCPYFQRNDFISRSKIQLNIAQDEVYSHVNSLRICYLSNNRCAIVSEPENDPAGYLGVIKIAAKNEIPLVVSELIHSGGWRDLADAIYDDYRSKPSLKANLEALLEQSFSTERKNRRGAMQAIKIGQNEVAQEARPDKTIPPARNALPALTARTSQTGKASLLRRVVKEILKGR